MDKSEGHIASHHCVVENSVKETDCKQMLLVDKSEGHIASHHCVVENSVKETDCKQMLLDMYEQEFNEPSPKQMKNKMQHGNTDGYISSCKDIALSKEDINFWVRWRKESLKWKGIISYRYLFVMKM